MKTSLSHLIIVVLAVTLPAAGSSLSYGQQTGGQSWFDGGTYHSQREVDAMYERNAQGPLGGLFAADFTRTLTVLGGFNFPSAAASDLGGNDSGDGALVPSPFDFLSLDSSGYAISFAFGRRHSRKLRSEIEVAFRSNDINSTGSPIDFIGDGFDAAILTAAGTNEEQRDGSVNATSLMKNFFIDFENTTRFTPYVGAGLGLSYVDIEFGQSSSIDGEATFQDGEGLFSYQAIGGVATRVNSFTDFVVEYRFLGTSEVEFDGLDQSLAYNTSTLFLGAKFEY